MRIRKILICVLTGMLCFGFFSPREADAAQTPQEFVKEFYEWYIIKHYEFQDIFENEKLPEYVDESLIEDLKRKGSTDLYYFIHFSETVAFKDCNIVVKDVLKMKDDVFVVRQYENRLCRGSKNGFDNVLRAGVHRLAAADNLCTAEFFKERTQTVACRYGNKAEFLFGGNGL